MYELYHETSFRNLENILNEFTLYKSSFLTSEFIIGQGGRNRKLTNNPKVSLTDKSFYNYYDEVDGVYFRLKKISDVISLKTNDVLLLFSGGMLDEYDSVINTEENFGFMISENGVECESQFSGEIGISIYNRQDIDLLRTYNFDFERSEVAILDNVCLKFLKKIYLKKKFQTLLLPKIVEKAKTNSIEVFLV